MQVPHDPACSTKNRRRFTVWPTAHRPPSMAQAACRGVDRALFFPERTAVSPKALALCSSCPVRQECLDRAMADPDMHGVWGGTSKRERQKMRNLVA